MFLNFYFVKLFILYFSCFYNHHEQQTNKPKSRVPIMPTPFWPWTHVSGTGDDTNCSNSVTVKLEKDINDEDNANCHQHKSVLPDGNIKAELNDNERESTTILTPVTASSLQPLQLNICHGPVSPVADRRGI